MSTPPSKVPTRSESSPLRPARRPTAWVAPGPAPTGSREEALALLAAGEDCCHLLGDWRIFQRVGGHRWSLDDLLTAWLAVDTLRGGPAAVGAPASALDLGTGIGSVLLMLAWHFPATRFLGVEAQAVSVGLARRSLAWNGVGERAVVREGDLRASDEVGFDLVTGTPPYWKASDGTASDAVQKGPCRFEHRGGVEDYCVAARRAVAPDGLVVLCHAALQGDRLIAAAADAGLHLLREVRVAGRVGKAPLVVVAAFGTGAAASPPARDAFAVRDLDGQWTPEFRALRVQMGMPDQAPSR